MRTKMVISWIFFVVFLGTSKSLFAQTISINIKNATLEETLKKIKQVSGFDMVFKMKDIKDIKKHINLQVEDKDIREVLQSCLQEHDLIFNIYNKTIIIFRKSTQIPEMRTIKGYIRDDSHQPLAEASIRLEESQLGTISNKNGEFIFRIPARNKSRLVVSYIGKKTAYIPLSHDSLYLIMLETAVSQVENIIVNGYQTVAKNEMTGAVSTIKGKDIRTSGSNSLEAAFQGMLNGLKVIIPSGNIGSTGHMKIRGASTVVGNPEPLVVVDGIIRENAWAFDQNTLYDLLNNGNLANTTRASIMGNNLSGINVDDIASITLLKDVSATAIYGIKATNGVIVITTKQGNINNQKITFRQNKYTGETGIELGYTPNKISEYNYSAQEKRFQYIRNNFPGIYPEDPQNYSLKDHEMNLIDRVENVFSLYGTLGYTFNSRYTFTLNLRNDASNRFGKNTNNRFYPVWSTGFRWDLHQEKWFPRQKWINEITLRTSYGHQGNVVSNISPNTLVSYVSKDLITNEEQLQLDQLPNPDLKWEKTTSLNIGTDFSLFQNRLNISFDLYKKKISDIVVEKEIPIENGFQKMFINSGTLDNQGYELEIEAIPVQTNLWEWRIRFTAGHTKDILDRSDADQQTLEHFTNGRAIVDRFPISAFWSFPFIGLSPTNGSPLFATMDQPNGVSQKVPDSLLEYLMYSGCREPRLFGGIQTNIRYKRITLNAIFNYQVGHYKRLNPFISSSKDGMMAIPSPEMNASRELLYRWKQAGDEKTTNIPSLQNKDENVSCYLPDNSLSRNSYGDIYRYSLYNRSNARIVSASHIRCNRISLSYHTTLARIADLNLSFTITNPFIIKNRKLKQQDPEISTSDADYYTPTMSRPKNYSLGIEIIF